MIALNPQLQQHKGSGGPDSVATSFDVSLRQYSTVGLSQGWEKVK